MSLHQTNWGCISNCSMIYLKLSKKEILELDSKSHQDFLKGTFHGHNPSKNISLIFQSAISNISIQHWYCICISITVIGFLALSFYMLCILLLRIRAAVHTISESGNEIEISISISHFNTSYVRWIYAKMCIFISIYATFILVNLPFSFPRSFFSSVQWPLGHNLYFCCHCIT